jgi:hypothetical protein
MRCDALLLSVLFIAGARADWTAKPDPPAKPVKLPAGLKVEIVAPSSGFGAEVSRSKARFGSLVLKIGEPTIRDVCATCNNGVLSELGPDQHEGHLPVRA